MGELKPGWTRVKFGDVVRLSKERCVDPLSAEIDRYIGLEHIDPGDLRLRTWGDVADGTTFTTRVRPGQVLFGKRRAYQRKIAVADFNAVCSGDIYVFESGDHKRLLPELLPFLCQTEAFLEHAVGTSAGSLSPRTNWTSLKEFECALPPIKDQRQLTTALLAAEQMLQCLGASKETLDVIGKRLIDGYNIGCMEYAKTSSLLLEPVVRGWSPVCNDQQEGYPTLPAGSIYSGVVDTRNNLKYAVLDDPTYNRYRLQKDDVLVLRGNGNREYVGRAGIVEELEPNCFFPDLLVRLRFDKSKIDPVVANIIWNSASVHLDLVRKTKTSNGIFKLGFDDIRDHEIPLPTPSQQEAIRDNFAKWLSARESLETREDQALSIKTALLDTLSGTRQ